MLPTLDVPIYTVTLPSNNKQVRIRPFLVKEEKLLLMAATGKDVNEAVQTTLQIVNNCLIDKDVDVLNLPFFDVDYLFASMRAKSISETVEINFTCQNLDSEGNTCNHIFPLELDITKATITKDDQRSDKIELSSKAGITMAYPKYAKVKQISNIQDPMTSKLELIKASIQQIYDGQTVYTVGDMGDELDKFLDGLTLAQAKKLEDWVDNLPYFEIYAEKICEKCKFHHKIRYKNVHSFFL